MRKSYSLGLNILVSLVLLFIFFGNILQSPNELFFSNSGDGLKSTYGSYYHLQYDSSYWHAQSMNYPYGESVLFTGSQALIINPLKFLASMGIDLSSHLTGILNVWLLLSIVLAALFLFLLLRNLKLPWGYALIVAQIIAFLSPQLGRMGGHFNLGYVYILPLFLYLLKRFYDKPGYTISILIGLLSFFTLGTHAYFFVFYAIWIFFVLFYGYFYEKNRLGKVLPSVYYMLIQVVLPFVIFNMITWNYPSDRSAFPWGFFETRSFPEAVFLPFDKPYAPFIHYSYLKWEGMAFIGMVASVGSVVLLFNYLRIKIKGRFRQFGFVGNRFLNAVLLGSIVALFISFAYPFNWHLEGLLKYTGPFKQFRAVGRFNWLFFYSINIIVFYSLWNYYKRRKNIFRKGLLGVALLWGIYDAYLNVRHNETWLSNSIPQLVDSQNENPENNWINEIDIADYQAILSLPYFHIGSEVYWIGNSTEVEKISFIVSWKTGLPLTSVMLSRTSITQTMKSLGLYFEPIRPYEILDDFPNRKDLLVLVQNGEPLNAEEARFLEYATPIEHLLEYSVYRISIDAIQKLNSDFQQRIIAAYSDTLLIPQNDYLISDSSNAFIFQSYGNSKPDRNREHTTLKYSATKTVILIDTLLFQDTSLYRISFWMNDLDQDLIPRSVLKLNREVDEGEFQQMFLESIFKKVKYVDTNGWGLVEIEYKPTHLFERIRLEVWNDLVTGGYFEFDDMLIQPAKSNIFYSDSSFIFKNNRYIDK